VSLLSIAGFALIALGAGLLLEALRRSTGSIVHAVLLCFVALELIAVLQIESLSLVSAYRAGPVTMLWGVVAVGAFCWLRRAPRVAIAVAPWSRWELIVAGAWIVMLGGTLVTALWGTPNTWDALTYHLPRVMHWIQNSSIEHYATAFSPQVKFPPLAEILVSQTVLLSGGDRLVNLVQWIAFGVTALAIYGALRGAGSSRLTGLSGALLFLSVPMAVLQASGPKNDLVLCANLAAAIVFFRTGFRGFRWRWMIAGAAALGLAILSKGTGLIFGGILAGLLLAAVLRQHGVRKSAGLFALLAVTIAVTNGGHYARNLRWFGSFFGPETAKGGYQERSQTISLATLTSNLLRNVMLELETPSVAINRRIVSAVGAAHSRLGLRIDDPASTWPDGKLDLARFPSRDEDRSGNPLQFLAICVALVAACWSERSVRHDEFAKLVSCGLVSAGAAFCLLLKWQPWHTRLHLPLFAVGCLLVALAAWRRPRALAVGVLLVATTSLPTLLANRSRPLLGEQSVFRRSRAASLFRFDATGGKQLSRRLAQLRPTRIGLRLEGNEPEYLIWSVAREAAPGIRLDHVGTFLPPPIGGASLAPVDTVVTYGDDARDVVWIEGTRYRFDRRCGKFAVWRLKERGRGS
jgi:4-amino-4-deoxy-L-arabinose transferase-like glycosyltransferase